MKKTMRLVLLSIILFCFKARAGSNEGIDSTNYEKEEFVDLIENIDKIPTTFLEAALQGKFASFVLKNVFGSPGSQQIYSIRKAGLSSIENFPMVILNGVSLFIEAASITGINPLGPSQFWAVAILANYQSHHLKKNLRDL